MTRVKDMPFVTVEQVNALRAKALELEKQRDTLFKLASDSIDYLWSEHDTAFLDSEDDSSLDDLANYVYVLKTNKEFV